MQHKITTKLKVVRFITMKTLIFFYTFIAVVKAGKVDLRQVQAGTHEEMHSNFNELHHEENLGEDILIINKPFHKKLDFLFEEEDDNQEFEEDIVIGNPDFQNDWHYTEDCENHLPPSTSYVTMTSTKLVLDTLTHSALHLRSSVDTVYVTDTIFTTTTDIIYGHKVTVTGLPPIEDVWTTLTKTNTKVLEKFYTNMIRERKTFTISTQETEVAIVCNTHKVYGSTIYVTTTTLWKHTLTMHEKTMISTVWTLTVTATDHQSWIEDEKYTVSYTVTETVYQTKFDIINHKTASTLWVTEAVKFDC